MPLPTPRNGENRAEFVDRCLADSVIQREYPTMVQRQAVCFSQWDEKHAQMREADLSLVGKMADALNRDVR